MKVILISMVFVLSLFSARAQDKDKEQILKVMDAQVKAWNEGDIHGFMQTYWKSDSLLFLGSAGPIYGWESTLQRYLKSYPDKKTMGKTSFDILEVRSLSPQYAFVVSKWRLEREKGDIGGVFTLLFRKVDGQWVIAADHTTESLSSSKTGQ